MAADGYGAMEDPSLEFSVILLEEGLFPQMYGDVVVGEVLKCPMPSTRALNRSHM